MLILLWVFILMLSLIAIGYSADKFIDNSKILGKSIGISDLLIGILIVSIGTSLPEFITSIIATYKGELDIVVSDVLGSNIANILLVLSVGVLILKSIELKDKPIFTDLLILNILSFIVLIFSLNKVLDKKENFIFFVFLILYYAFLIKEEKNRIDKNIKKEQIEKDKLALFGYIKTIFYIVVFGFLLYLGSEWAIKSIIEISKITNIGKDVIAATAVSIGTSLPELIVSIVAGKKGDSNILVGNVIGSNIFNIVSVFGIVGLFIDLPISNINMNYTIPFLVFSSILLYIVSMKKKFYIWDGFFMIILYIVFIFKLYGLI